MSYDSWVRQVLQYVVQVLLGVKSSGPDLYKYLSDMGFRYLKHEIIVK